MPRQGAPGALELGVEEGAADAEGRHAVEVRGEAHAGAERDHPLGGVPLVPADAVAVVVLEDVVEVVIALAVGEEGEKAVVPGAVALRVGTRAPEVREGVDEEPESLGSLTIRDYMQSILDGDILMTGADNIDESVEIWMTLLNKVTLKPIDGEDTEETGNLNAQDLDSYFTPHAPDAAKPSNRPPPRLGANQTNGSDSAPVNSTQVWLSKDRRSLS